MLKITRDLAKSTPPVESLDDLADQPRWVAWREETRERRGATKYSTKIPYAPNRRNEQARITAFED
jgi:hypothetical protein